MAKLTEKFVREIAQEEIYSAFKVERIRQTDPEACEVWEMIESFPYNTGPEYVSDVLTAYRILKTQKEN